MFTKEGRTQPGAEKTAADEGRGRAQRSLGWFAACTGALFMGACTQKIANADEASPVLSSEPSKATLAVFPQPPAGAIGAIGASGTIEEDQPTADDTELRRGYGAVDMRYQACVTQEDANILVGKDCSSGFTIYGPYVRVPANSEIEVSFELSSNKTIEVYADIVSRMATQTLAGLNRQTVPAGGTRTIGYRVHVFNEDVNIESRIGFAGAAGIEFRISDLTMTVR